MGSGTTTVGSVKYDASIDLAQLKKSLNEGDKLVEKSYKRQSQAAKKATQSTPGSAASSSGTSESAAQKRVAEIKAEAQQTLNTLSSYTPKLQAQYLGLERANMRVTSATSRSSEMIQKYGKDSSQAQNASDSLTRALFTQSQAQSRLGSSLDQTSAKTYSFNKSTESVAVSLTAMKAAAIALGAAVAVNIGNAVSRFDTLNNAPKVLQNLGNSAEQSNKALSILDSGIRGLPTSLDSAVNALTKISAASNMSADSAAILTLAFNNMALAGGKGPQEAERALVQFTQALGKGTLPAEEFNTLMDVMPAQMKQVAVTMLGAGANAYTLRDAMSEGTVGMGDFASAIIKLNSEGGEGFASFADQAKSATAGLATGWSNLQIAITRGITSIINAIGGSNIQGALQSIGQAFEYALNIIAGMINFISANWNVFGPLAQVLVTVGATLIAATVAMRAFAAVSAASSAVFGTMRLILLGNSIAAAAAARGNYALATSLVAARGAAIKAIASFTLIGAAMAAIGFIMGEVLGNMSDVSDETSDTAGSAEDINKAMQDAQKNIAGAAEDAGDLAKQMAKINEQAQKAREDYRYSLAQLVADKNKGIATLTKTLSEEEKAYNNAYNERLTSFNKTQNEELLTHEQKTRSLQNQIDFLSQYNTAANQQQLSELQFALARENSEYQKSTQLREGELAAQTDSAKAEYEARRLDNQNKLNEELALLAKHRDEVMAVRDVMLLDEIETLQKQRDEQLKSLQQQAQDALASNTSSGAAAGGAFSDNFNQKIDDMVKGMGGKGAGAGRGFIESMDSFIKQSAPWLHDIGRWVGDQIWNGMKFYNEYLKGKGNWNSNVNQGLENVKMYGPLALFGGGSLWQFADGGFTGRGGKYQAAGIVHAGEYVLPKEQVNQATGMPDWSKIGGSSQSINVNVSLSGVMTSSKADERAVATRIGKLINEAVKSKTGKTAIAGV